MPIITKVSNESLPAGRIGGKDLAKLEISCGRLFKVSDKRMGANAKVLFSGTFSTEKGFQDTPYWYLDHRIFSSDNKGWARFLDMFINSPAGAKGGDWQYVPTFEDIVLPEIEREDYDYYPLWVLQTLKKEGFFEKALRTTPINGSPEDDKMIQDKEELEQYYHYINVRAKKEMEFLKEHGINEPVNDTRVLHELRLKSQKDSRKFQLDLAEKEKLDNYLDEALAHRNIGAAVQQPTLTQAAPGEDPNQAPSEDPEEVNENTETVENPEGEVNENVESNITDSGSNDLLQVNSEALGETPIDDEDEDLENYA